MAVCFYFQSFPVLRSQCLRLKSARRLQECEFLPFGEILSCDGSQQAVEKLDIWMLGKSMQRILTNAIHQ
jgi:hypothetical protein